MEELKNYSLLPVTALHFCHLNGVEVLLEGKRMVYIKFSSYYDSVKVMQTTFRVFINL